MTRAKVRTDAGIPLGTADAPTVATAFQQRGINIDENHPMTRPLSAAEQAVYGSLAKKMPQDSGADNGTNPAKADQASATTPPQAQARKGTPDGDNAGTGTEKPYASLPDGTRPMIGGY